MKEELNSIMITIDTPKDYVKKLSNKCDKCGHCCSFDSGIFLDEDIERISKKLSVPKDDFKKRFLEKKEIFNKKVHKAKLKREGKPFGPCYFLNKNKSCSIHDIKPKHCKLGSGCNEYGQQINLWFTLNHLVDKEDPEAIRQWAQYLKTHPTIPGGELKELISDDKKLANILSYKILK